MWRLPKHYKLGVMEQREERNLADEALERHRVVAIGCQ